MRIVRNLMVVDADTAEVLGKHSNVLYFRTEEQCKAIQKALQKKERNRTYAKHGQFCFIQFERGLPLYSKMKPANLTRILYLASYMDYKTNTLKCDNHTPMRKELVIDKLGISERAYYGFLLNCKESELIHEASNGDIILSSNFFHRGSLSPRIRKGTIRLYKKGIRQLFENPSISDKKLSYVFRLIPYVNVKYNLVCHNQFEEDYSMIEPLNYNELFNVLNYSKSNASKLLRDIANMRFNDGQFVIHIDTKDDGLRLHVNPHLFYAGIDFDAIDAGRLFT